MTESMTKMLSDPGLAWDALQQAVQEHREGELAEIAISLYGQLGEAKAEATRLRASLKSSLRALASAGLRAWD